VDLILETDMARHFELHGKFRGHFAAKKGSLRFATEPDRCQALSMGLKCADLGHVAKEQHLHVLWSNLITEEFFQQGDAEKRLDMPVSLFFDRETTNIPKS
jgi:3',5'-cyclic-nucleotide phosphodiesterase/cAMP-specific phosphodiesterase 4